MPTTRWRSTPISGSLNYLIQVTGLNLVWNISDCLNCRCWGPKYQQIWLTDLHLPDYLPMANYKHGKRFLKYNFGSPIWQFGLLCALGTFFMPLPSRWKNKLIFLSGLITWKQHHLKLKLFFPIYKTRNGF